MSGKAGGVRRRLASTGVQPRFMALIENWGERPYNHVMKAGQAIGRYEIIKEIGRGGMAVVYLALDPYMQRQVAIKVLPRQFTFESQFRERFMREAQMIAALEHPAIVPVYDFGEHDDQPFLVMRYMAGGSLRQRLNGSLPFAQTEQILQRLAPALDRAHQRGIIHRDLKPENVLFDEEDRAYLSDFGIARMAEATQTMTIVGTPAYMSPEQVQGDQKLDGRSDLYALGVVLFELLTGQPPYTAPTPTKLMLKHILEPVPEICTINPGLPQVYEGFVQQVMAKERGERFATGAALAAAFTQLAAAPTIPAAGTTAVPDQTIVEPPAFMDRPTIVDEDLPPLAPMLTPPTPPTAPTMVAGQQRRLPAWGWAIVGIVLLALLGGGAFALFGRDQATSTAETAVSTTPAAALLATPRGTMTTAAPAAAAILATSAVETGAIETAVPTLIADMPELQSTTRPTATTDPIEVAWQSSAHADAAAEAFVHWNGDDPAEIPTTCARCHSTPGFLDYVGADGSEALVVDEAAPVGTVITCDVCHHTAVETLSEVIMPSGIQLQGLGQEAVCMQCHQGRSSTVNINERTGGLDDDEISGDLGFVNIHYYAAAASLFGTEAMGAYEYDWSGYVGRYEHVSDYNACIECHDAHTLTVRAQDCAECHEGADTVGELHRIRYYEEDWDGDGDITEGAAGEIDTMRDALLEALQAYANDWIGTPIGYDATTYPYFFIDSDDDGLISADEGDRYIDWTPRLLRATYNYQFSIKDPGLFAHNPLYALQILYDSIEDLGGDTSGMIRP